jgi:hypothetical protein
LAGVGAVEVVAVDPQADTHTRLAATSAEPSLGVGNREIAVSSRNIDLIQWTPAAGNLVIKTSAARVATADVNRCIISHLIATPGGC